MRKLLCTVYELKSLSNINVLFSTEQVKYFTINEFFSFSKHCISSLVRDYSGQVRITEMQTYLANTSFSSLGW